jgi:osmotically-inducible protein OsmY
MADRYSERAGQRWEDDERRSPYESRFRERDWGYGGRGDARGEDRGFFDRAGDEVRSWFGDEEAQRRRMLDEREDWRGERGRGDWGWRDWGRGDSGWFRGRGDWMREPDEREWSRQWGYIDRSPRYADRWGDWSRGYGSYGSGAGGYGGHGPWGHERDWRREPGWAGFRSESASPYAGPHAGRGPRGYQRADERIREDVCERFARHGYLDPTDIEIHVQSGEVTLQGTVTDRWAKRTAEDIAEGVWGVKEVHNQLRISQSASAPEGHENREGRTGPQRGNWAA